MKILLVEAQLKGFSRVKDNSVKLNFQTNRELTSEEFALVDKYFQENGYLAFKMDEIAVEDIPADNSKIKGQYSPSQTLRRKIFALHMKKGGSKQDFTPYYNKIMAGFEESVQQKLDELED